MDSNGSCMHEFEIENVIYLINLKCALMYTVHEVNDTQASFKDDTESSGYLGLELTLGRNETSFNT